MIFPQEYKIDFKESMPREILSEAHICQKVKYWFGLRFFYGTALMMQEEKGDKFVIVCYENRFREFFKNRKISHAVEIGTKYGLSSLIMAYYVPRVTTIDIVPRTEPLELWQYFNNTGRKITYAVVENNEEKKTYLEDKDFDFAFIDGDHGYEEVKFDFDTVKRCGRVLFHDYGTAQNMWKKGVVKLVNELPKDEVEIKQPFAYWEKR
jgi:hypothetical protein